MPRPALVRTHKKCSACGEEKTVDSFYTQKNKNKKPGLSAYCKTCHTARHRKKYHAETPEVRARRRENARASHLSRKFGLTTEEFSAMLLGQNSECKICGCHMDDPQIDHNHDTGKVRALLCSPCNLSLGLLKENPETLHNMITYINDYLPKNSLA